MASEHMDVTLSLTWPSRLLLWGLRCVLNVCIWLAYWFQIDLTDWAEDFTGGVINDLQWTVETQTSDAITDAKLD